MNTHIPGDSTPRSKMSPASRRRRRGAAYAETVVMLPFFIIVWSCIIYVHNAYSEKLRLMAQNRNCVMAYAYNACSSPPPGCSVSPGGSASGGTPGEVSDFTGALGSFGSGLLSTLTGSSVSSRMNSTVAKPRVLGGGSTSVLAGNTMQCNTRYQDNPVRAVGAAFCSFVGIGC